MNDSYCSSLNTIKYSVTHSPSINQRSKKYPIVNNTEVQNLKTSTSKSGIRSYSCFCGCHLSNTANPYADF